MLADLWRRIMRRPVTGAAAPAAPSPAPIPVLTVGEGPAPSLAILLRAAGFGDADTWAAHLAEPMRQRAIRGPRRVAAFLATIGHESNGGRDLEEGLNYSAERLLAKFSRARISEADARMFGRLGPVERPARHADQVALANILYGREFGARELGNVSPGDGWLYRGRGLIQITGAANYRAASNALSLPLLTAPDLAAQPPHAAEIAAWWWAAHGCNDLADAGEIEAWRKRVNGGLVGLDDVRRRYQLVLAEIGAAQLSA